MSPGVTADRVYEALKRQILSGELKPGERLDPARLAGDLAASATPVRDALHQLLGERIIEARPHAGFSVRIETEAGLRDLYEWHADLLAAVLRRQVRPARVRESPDAEAHGGIASTTATLFLAMAGTTGNLEHFSAMALACDRLCAARRAEPHVLADLEPELDGIASAWHAGDGASLRRLAASYHRRRLAEVPAIASLLRPSFDHRGL
jgi:DNA-binding GntR family transcriptional regulator